MCRGPVNNEMHLTRSAQAYGRCFGERGILAFGGLGALIVVPLIVCTREFWHRERDNNELPRTRPGFDTSKGPIRFEPSHPPRLRGETLRYVKIL